MRMAIQNKNKTFLISFIAIGIIAILVSNCNANPYSPRLLRFKEEGPSDFTPTRFHRGGGKIFAIWLWNVITSAKYKWISKLSHNHWHFLRCRRQWRFQDLWKAKIPKEQLEALGTFPLQAWSQLIIRYS